jgi:hypothetical protein
MGRERPYRRFIVRLRYTQCGHIHCTLVRLARMHCDVSAEDGGHPYPEGLAALSRIEISGYMWQCVQGP